MHFLKGDRSWSPLFRYAFFSCFFHLCDFRFHGFYQLCELFLAFLSCLGVYVLGDAFAVDSWREPPLVEVVIYHSNASCAGLAYLALVRLKFRLCGGWLLTCLGWLWFGHFGVCTAYFSVNANRRLLLHGVRNVAVDIQRGFCADVADHSRQGLNVHAAFERHGSEGMAQVVEADTLAVGSLEDELEAVIECRGVARLPIVDR